MYHISYQEKVFIWLMGSVPNWTITSERHVDVFRFVYITVSSHFLPKRFIHNTICSLSSLRSAPVCCGGCHTQLSLFVCSLFHLSAACRGWGRSTTAPSGPWSRPTSTMSWDSMRSQVPSACCPLLARVCLSTLKKDLALSLRWIWTACSHKLIHCYVMHICLSYINEMKQVS